MANPRSILLTLAVICMSGCGTLPGSPPPAPQGQPAPADLPAQPTAAPAQEGADPAQIITLTPFPSNTPPPASGADQQASEAAEAATFIYGSTRGLGIGLHLLSADGRLAGPAAPDGIIQVNAVWPDLSPDGQRIVYAGVQGSSAHLPLGLFIFDRIEGSVTQIVEGDGLHPRWSPDGSQIAYTCSRGGDICIINVDGSSPRNITQGSEAVDRYPDWLSDTRLVFMSSRDVTPVEGDLRSEIYSINSDGSGISRLTQDQDAYNAYPSAAPSAGLIAFESDRDTGLIPELYVMNADGSNIRRITTDDLWNQNPVFSPDESRILYAAADNGGIDLYETAAGGGASRQVTRSEAEDGGLRFGHAYLGTLLPLPPAAQREDRSAAEPPAAGGSDPYPQAILLAASDLNCPDCLPTGIYRVQPDGSDLTQLPVRGFYPTWAPNHSRFAYISQGEAYLANADGSSAIQITDAYAGLSALEWANSGQIVLAECTPYLQYDACIVDLNTGAIRNLTPILTPDVGIPRPTWNRGQIVLGSYILNNRGELINELDITGRVSPDGTRIVRVLDGEIVISQLDGSQANQLTNDGLLKSNPIWSPNGQSVLYTAFEADQEALYLWTVGAPGTAPAQLITSPFAAGDAQTYLGYSWAP